MASESQGASGLRTAKLSPISGNVAGAGAEHPAPVQSGELRHPYSNMSTADYNVEPTGNLGLTLELTYTGSEAIMNPISRKHFRNERLFTSTISRPIHTFTDDNEPDFIDFCQCDCTWCSERINSVAKGAQDSATRKPIPYGELEGSRDVPDVPTLTDVPTRPPMYDATGAEFLGAEMSCPSEASSQDAEMSRPSEASSQDVRPVVSTADAMPLNPPCGNSDSNFRS